MSQEQINSAEYRGEVTEKLEGLISLQKTSYWVGENSACYHYTGHTFQLCREAYDDLPRIPAGIEESDLQWLDNTLREYVAKLNGLQPEGDPKAIKEEWMREELRKSFEEAGIEEKVEVYEIHSPRFTLVTPWDSQFERKYFDEYYTAKVRFRERLSEFAGREQIIGILNREIEDIEKLLIKGDSITAGIVEMVINGRVLSYKK